MDDFPMSPDMWSDEPDTEHTLNKSIDEDENCPADDDCINSLFKTPLSAPRRRGTPLNKSLSLSNTKPRISQIPESLLPIVNQHDISWTSSLATPIAGDGANSSTNFNTEERKVLLPCQDETVGRRILFPQDDHKTIAGPSDKTPKSVRSRAKTCAKSLQSTPTPKEGHDWTTLPEELPLSPILDLRDGAGNQTPRPSSARLARNRRLSSECRSSQVPSLQPTPVEILPADEESSPSILTGQPMVTVSPPKSPIIGLRWTSRGQNKKARLSLQSQQMRRDVVTQNDDSVHKSVRNISDGSGDNKEILPIAGALSSKQIGDCARPLKVSRKPLKDVDMLQRIARFPQGGGTEPTVRTQGCRRSDRSKSGERRVGGQGADVGLALDSMPAGKGDCSLKDDEEIMSSPIISCNKVSKRKRKLGSLSLTSSRSRKSELCSSSPLKVPKNSLSADEINCSVRASTSRDELLATPTLSATECVDKLGPSEESVKLPETSPAAPNVSSEFASQNDLSINTIQEIYKVADLIESMDTERTVENAQQPSKKLKFLNASKKDDRQPTSDSEPKCVGSRVQRIKTNADVTKSLHYLYPDVDGVVKSKSSFAVDVNQLGEYARLLEVVANLDGKVPRRAAPVPPSNGFVQFSELQGETGAGESAGTSMCGDGRRSSAERNLPDRDARGSHRNGDAVRVRKSARNECEGISSTQITRLVADAERMFETEDSRWGFNASETNVDDNPNQQDGGLANGTVQQHGSHSTVNASNVNESGSIISDSKSGLIAVSGVGANNITPKTVANDLTGFTSASGKELCASEAAMQKARSVFGDDEFTVDELVTPKGGAGKAAGFSSARGIKLSISKVAMNNARKLFSDLDSPMGKDVAAADSDGLTPKVDPAALGGFGAASGKKLGLSDASVKKARTLFNDIDAMPGVDVNLDTPKTDSKFAGGFSSASGKKFTVSDAAMKKAKSLFEEVDSPSVAVATNTPKMDSKFACGFSSASGKKFTVSDAAMKKAKSLFEEADSPSVEPKDVVTPRLGGNLSMGFSSGSGKKFNVSEDAVKKARTLFDDADSTSGRSGRNETPMGFLSASGKKCSVSDAALAQARTLFGAEDPAPSNESDSERARAPRGRGRPHELPSDRPRNAAFKRPTSTEVPPSDASESASGTSADARLVGFSAAKSTDAGEPQRLVVFSAASGRETAVDSESALREAKTLFSQDPTRDIDPSAAVDRDFGRPTIACNAVPTALDIAEVRRATEAFLADEESGAPAWITAYTSSPSACADRMDLRQPMVDGVVVVDRVGPALGGHDRFRRAAPVAIAAAAAKGDPTVFKTPCRRNDSGAMSAGSAANNAKRGGDFEFGTPFSKRARPETSGLPSTSKQADLSTEEVARLRQEAWESQLAAVKTKDSLSRRPCQGSQLLRKLDRQMSWQTLTQGRTPGQYTRAQLVKLGVREDVINVTAENAADFVFSAHNHYGPSVCRGNTHGLPVGDDARLVLDARGRADAARFETAFLASPGVDPALVPGGWVRNHFRWVVWKLAATELGFPRRFAARCVTPNAVMLQLKYRYDREMDRCERPALRRILEQDDTASRRLVLCVARTVGESRGFELELTDGWYSVMASLDSELSRLVAKGVVDVGTKLVVHGAELSSREPCSPLEAKSDTRLKLCANSTRRARWHARLGFQRDPGPMRLRLRSLLPSGGLVGRVDLYVARVYPTLYVETLAGGNKVTRSEIAESRAAAAFERLRQDRVEAAYAKVRAELRDAANDRPPLRNALRNIATVTSGSQLCRLLEQSPDPASLQELLSADQLAEVEKHRQRSSESTMRDVEARVQQALADGGDKRNVSTLLKLRCLDADAAADCAKSAVLSVWRAPDDLAALLREGGALSVFNVSAQGSRAGVLQLSAGRTTRYQARNLPASGPDPLARRVTSFAAASAPDFRPPFAEADVVGVVALVVDGNGRLQTAYLVDAAQSFLGVAVWTGLKDCGLDELLRPGAVVAASNLQWRTGPVRRVVHLHFAETSVFSRNPRQPHLRAAVEALSAELKRDCAFVANAREKLLAILADTTMPANPTPACPTTPQTRPAASTYCPPTPQLSQPGAESPSPAQLRIERLRCYSDPPPLPPLAITSSPGIAKEFRLPVRSFAEVTAVVEDCDSPPLSLE